MRHLTKGKGNSERAHKPTSNGVFPHVASPLEGRVVSHPIWGMLPFYRILCVIFPSMRKKARGNHEGWQVANIGTYVPCVYSILGWKDPRRGHGDMES